MYMYQWNCQDNSYIFHLKLNPNWQKNLPWKRQLSHTFDFKLSPNAQGNLQIQILSGPGGRLGHLGLREPPRAENQEERAPPQWTGFGAILALCWKHVGPSSAPEAPSWPQIELRNAVRIIFWWIKTMTNSILILASIWDRFLMDFTSPESLKKWCSLRRKHFFTVSHLAY